MSKCNNHAGVVPETERALRCKDKSSQRATKGSLVSAIQACSRTKNLVEARRLHLDATINGIELETYLACSLIAMYAKCGSMADAKKVFNSMRSHDVMAWNALMLGYVENGEAETALQLFDSMVTDGCPLTARAYVTVIKACTTLATKEAGKLVTGKAMKVKALEKGASIHFEAEKKKFSEDIYVASSLVGMYAKCGSMAEARRVFDGMANRSVVTWNTLMLGYVENGECGKALTLYEEMKRESCSPNARTFVALLKACTMLSGSEAAGSLEKGMALHSQAAKRGFDLDLFVSSGLVYLYSKCGAMEDAERVFDRMVQRDVVVWTALILGYGENGQSEVALNLFAVMQQEVNKADARAFVAVLKACTCLAEKEHFTPLDRPVKVRALETGMAIHALIRKNKSDRNIYVSNSLVDCYAKCGNLFDAQRVFGNMSVHDTVSWNVLIQAFVDKGEGSMALELFLHMQSEGVPVDEQTLVAAARACASVAAEEAGVLLDGKLVKVKSLERGMALHSLAESCGLKRDAYMVNQLVEVYAKCGSLLDARRAFDSLDARNTSSCNVMMQAYLDRGMNEQVLELYAEMVDGKKSPDYRSYSMVLKACACLSDQQTGKAIHGETCRRGLERHPAILTYVVDLYGKCGNSSLAQEAFGSVASEVQLLTTWNVLLAALCRQGDSPGVFRLFNEMLEAGLQPNCVTFLMVLGSCRHAGLVEQGKRIFCDMSKRYGVTPDIEHFHSMLDLLGRANQLEEAVTLVEAMPYKQNVVTWTTVLNSCLRWKNVEVGRYAFDALVQLEEENGAAYVLMASIYESVGLVEESRRIKQHYSIL